MSFIKIIIAAIFGIVEGITEWLPISSTGHMVLLNEFLTLEGDGLSAEFVKLFMVVIQVGAILAVIVIYWKKLWPFSLNKKEHFIKKDIWKLWFHILVSCIPFGIAGLLLDDIIDEMLGSYIVVAIALIVYGILFIIIEKGVIKHRDNITEVSQIDYKTAFIIGCIQVLAMIPGTSRSGISIIGAMLLGCSRVVSTEYTFYLAIPAMLGSSLVSILKYGLNFSGIEITVLIIGLLTAFIISYIAIRFLIGYIKKHNFVVFGWYRIALGIIVIAYFLIKNMVC